MKRETSTLCQDISNKSAYYFLYQVMDATEEKSTFYKKINLLDEPYRTVIYLRLASNLTFDEIVHILDQSANWARVTYYRSKERLKASYEKT